jgi:hypothetical protein
MTSEKIMTVPRKAVRRATTYKHEANKKGGEVGNREVEKSALGTSHLCVDFSRCWLPKRRAFSIVHRLSDTSARW